MVLLLHSLWKATIKRQLWQVKLLTRVLARYEEETAQGVEWLKVCVRKKYSHLNSVMSCDRLRYRIVVNTMQRTWHSVNSAAWSRRHSEKGMNYVPPLLAVFVVLHILWWQALCSKRVAQWNGGRFGKFYVYVFINIVLWFLFKIFGKYCADSFSCHRSVCDTFIGYIACICRYIPWELRSLR